MVHDTKTLFRKKIVNSYDNFHDLKLEWSHTYEVDEILNPEFRRKNIFESMKHKSIIRLRISKPDNLNLHHFTKASYFFFFFCRDHDSEGKKTREKFSRCITRFRAILEYQGQFRPLRNTQVPCFVSFAITRTV